MHHLVWEVVDNSIDEALAGHCNSIVVSLLPDYGISVEDNGRGIPVDLHKIEGRSALEVVMTVLHAGGKFDKDSYKVSGGLHGVGVSVVNALSSNCFVEVHRGGKIHRQEYERGVVKSPVKVVGKTKKTGTNTTFYPDFEIFRKSEFEFSIIDERLRELAFLNKDLTITLKDLRQDTPRETTHHYKGGLSHFVNHIDQRHTPVFDKPVYIRGEK